MMIIYHLKVSLNNNSINFEKILSFSKEVLILESFQLNKLEPELKLLYAKNSPGRKPRNPVMMLQSLVLMNLCNEASISKWVKITRTNTVIALICGCNPDDTPGVECRN